MSPTDSEPMSGDDLAREIANIATKQVYYSDPYITNDGVLYIENRSKFTHTTSPQIIEPTLKDISNQAEKNQMDDDLARHIANLDLQEVHIPGAFMMALVRSMSAAITLVCLFVEMLCHVLGWLHSSCVFSIKIGQQR